MKQIHNNRGPINGGGEQQEGEITKGHMETFEGDRCGHFFTFGIAQWL